MAEGKIVSAADLNASATEPRIGRIGLSARLSIAVFTRFHPNIGGIETVAELLAREWVSAGHRVTIVTNLAAVPGHQREFPFRVLHRPGPLEILEVVRECDLVLHHNISLRAFWPLLLLRKPLIAVNHDRYFLRADGSRPWKERLKVWIARHWAHNICVSHSTQRGVRCDGPVIHNLYDCTAFHNFARPRDKELVFLGRLVSDKGVNVLLDALSELKEHGFTPSLTVIGEGPERANIGRQVRECGLASQVTEAGRLSREKTVHTLNRHKVMVVPSVYEEGFGVVALEGAACGCVVVGAEAGGLPEAIGPCGVTFPKHQHRRLAQILLELLGDESRLEPYRRAAPGHLRAHHPDVVAAKYLEFFEQVLTSHRKGSRLFNRDRSLRPS